MGIEWGDDTIDDDFLGDEPPLKEYPQREIFRRSGRYTQCQILNWDKGPPPKFLACHPLDGTHTGFIAAQRMGTWAEIDIHEVERRLNGTWPIPDAQ